MPHMNKLSNYRTTWQGNKNKGQVVYVNTTIVFWDENCIQLRSGWFVDTPKGETLDFFDGIIIDRKVKL